MTLRTRIGAGITLSLATMLPLSAYAVTPGLEDPAKDPVVETPVTPTPVIETPVTPTPVVETPVTPTPVVETPVTPTPVTQTPVRDNPRSEGKPEREVRQPTREVVVTPRNQSNTMVYPQPSRANFCPQGLQPVTISGVISCGSPNKAVTYQQMLQHPAPAVRRVHNPKRTTYHRSARPSCGVGTKGCSDR